LRWALPVGRVLTLVVLVVTTLAAAAPGHRPAVAGGLAVSLTGSAYGLRFPFAKWRQRLVGLALLGAGGVVIMAIDGNAPGWLAAGIAITASFARLPQRPAVALVVPLALAAVLAPLVRGDVEAVAGIAAICGAFAVLGLILAGVRSRAETAERLLEVEQTAREATLQSERYAERQRLAREIHDILAHTLSAQAVQLEGARLLLQHGGEIDAVLERIESAQRLTRDGLEETRRAVHSLRGDSRPLVDTLRILASTAGAKFEEFGTVHALSAQSAVAFERTVQEALTNARKHAPGAAVSVIVRFGSAVDEVEILDDGATQHQGTLAGSGGGYGLAGMRERAELIGGELTTGPHPVGQDGRGYRVWLTVPRSATSAS